MNKIIIFSIIGVAVVGIVVSFLLSGKIVPLVSVNDQAIVNGRVVVSQATAVADSWLVIQTETNGIPGPVIGFTKIDKGENNDVSVSIDAQSATSKLFAMIHEDGGRKGEFDFPNDDMPLMYNDEMVSKMFNVQQ